MEYCNIMDSNEAYDNEDSWPQLAWDWVIADIVGKFVATLSLLW